jgi:hypothetical protein
MCFIAIVVLHVRNYQLNYVPDCKLKYLLNYEVNCGKLGINFSLLNAHVLLSCTKRHKH